MKNNFYRNEVINILEELSKLYVPKFIMAIDGQGGSGKSTLANELKDTISNSYVVHMDDFYKPKELRNSLYSKTEIGGYFDWKRVENEILIPFKENRKIIFQKYDWQAGILNEWVNIPESSSIIVEGVYSNRKELAGYYNLKVWIDCSESERLSRGIVRDGAEIIEYWKNVWLKQENEYCEKHKPFLNSDIRIQS